MQQTSKYQFNLVEGSDDFSPTPLNQNMEKVEEELSGLESSVMANLGTIGHNLRIQTGSYVGTGTYGQSNPKSLTFDLYPVVVMIVCETNAFASPPCIMMRPTSACVFAAVDPASMRQYVSWSEHGVSWYSNVNDYCHINMNGQTYHYLALGY